MPMTSEDIVKEVVAPDGCTYNVYSDGSWTQLAWDGSFVRDSNDWVKTYYGPDPTEANYAEARQEVVAKLGL